MFNFKLICVVIFLFNLHQIRSKISDKRLCANENCTEPISLAKTILRYASPDQGVLSFEANADVTVYSKAAGSNMALWGVEINGKRGYAPTVFLRETKVYTKNLSYLIETESSDEKVPLIKSNDIQETIKANKVPDYEVVDGTTFYFNSEDTIVPTPSESNIVPTAVKQNIEENDTLSSDTVNVNHEETQPLELQADKSIENEVNKLEMIQDTQSNHEEVSNLNLVKDNELKESDSVKDDSVEIKDDDSQEDVNKESLVENVLQTITNWINDDTKDSDKSDLEDYVVDDEDEGNVEDEEEEEDDDDEDYEEDEEEDSGESDVSDESDISTQVDTKSNEQSSDISEKSDSANVHIEDAANDQPSKSSSNLLKLENNDEEKSTLSEEKPNVKTENIVKTRQLLSEEEMFKDESLSETAQDEETMKSTIPVKKDEDGEETNSEYNNKETVPDEETMKNSIPVNKNGDREETKSEYNDKETIDSAIINTEANLDNVDNSKMPTEDEEHVETVTEASFTEMPGFDVPLPFDNDIHVTANPLENYASDPVDKSEMNTAKDEQVIVNNSHDDSSNDDSLSSLSNPKSDESENIEVENITNHDKEENIDEVENPEKVPASDSSPEVIDVEQSLSGANGDVNNELEEAGPETSSEQSLERFENNIEKEAAITNTEEISSEQASDVVASTGENELDKTSELGLNIPLNDDKEVILPEENQENISGLFTGFASWLGHGQNQNIDETASKVEETPTTISASEKDGNLNNEFDKIDNINTSKKQEDDIKDIIDGDDVPKGDAIETIEKHDHGFLSTIEDHIRQSSPDESRAGQVEENVSLDASTEVSNSETVSEESIENQRPEEILGSDRGFEKQELPSQELDKHEDTQTEDKLHLFDVHDHLLSKNSVDYGSCPAGESDCPDDIAVVQKQLEMEQVAGGYNFSDYLNLLTLLGATGLSVAIFLLGFITIDKNRKEGTLIAKINTLEKALLVASKENALLIDRVSEVQNETAMENGRISSEELEQLNKIHEETLVAKSLLEDQIQSLEKELENSTEVGLELNRMLSDIISSQNGSETLIANVEQLQRQLVEQQGTINTINDTLNLKDTENHELQLELEIKNKKVTHLQAELDKMAMNLFKVEEDKEQMQAKLESEILELKDHLEQNKNAFNSTRTKLLDEINSLKSKFSEVQRNLDVKTNEYTILKDNFNQIKTIKNNTEALQSLLNASSMKAELQQLQRDNQALSDVLREEQQTKFTLEKQAEIALQEAQSYKAKYDDSDRDKLEAQTKLEVLSNYFKDREAQLQKELSKQASLWVEHQGEATSTVERIKYMQEELQNCKSQNELLKQEIVSQEVELKSQISVLEKKAHESWLIARQAERRLEDAKQEAAQLRNRLTLKERSFIDDKGQNRIQSPLEQNGDLAVSPLHMPVESPASPPLLYGTRDHLTTPPPLPNLPPFLPPPPGVPFMPPPIPGVPNFMPPPPSMFPVDHRPPPLGRMSSPPPPMISRYSPDSRYSPYDRNSPSPPYDDEYGSSPPHLHRGYSPYNNRDDRRDYKRPPPQLRANGRNKGAISSGSGNSNESLEKINRHHSKV